MRFATTADTDNFIPTAETVFEPSELVSVIAQVTPDATVTDIGLTITEILVV